MAYAFLSSPVRNLEEIRSAVHGLQLPGDRKIWVDELDKPRPKGEPFSTIEDLFGLIREASVFIVLLGSDRHGSNLTIDHEKAHTTYWEIELFYAALLGKNVRVFEVEGFQPGDRLAALLNLLQSALPVTSWSGPHTRKNIVPAIQDFLLGEALRSTEWSSASRRLLRILVDGLFRLRGEDGSGGSAEKESLKFLNSRFADATVAPNEAVITRLLSEVRTLGNEEGRLTRLWIVFRELLGAPFANPRYLEFLPHWNSFFSEWASAGSWYGLHGHPDLAVLPALVEQTRVRERMRSNRSSAWKDDEITYPGGALASSRYSIAGLARSWTNRRILLHAALADLSRSLTEEPENTANLLAIRGSVYRRLGAVWSAVKDYEDVLRRRRDAGAPDSAIGEALAELGYGYLFQLRFSRGCSLLEEGVRILASSDVRSGFLVRAKRKLAVGYALTGHPWRARDELEDARALARKHGIYDQIR